jgi:hypothetical protein
MSIDKRVNYEVQGGVKNYLGKQKQVQAPIKWKSSPNHPETELAYITKAEKDLLVKKDLHGSLKGGVNRGPSGIMSLNGFGSTDESQNVSGTQTSAAEAGDVTGFAGTGSGAQLPPGVDRKNKTAEDIRSAFIAAGGGQRVNPGFFDNRNTVSPAELSRARAYNPTAFRAGRKNSFMDMLASGGILGNLVRGIGQQFGLGKTYNQPTYDMRGLYSINPNNLDIYNEFVDDNKEEETMMIPNVGSFGIIPKRKPSRQFIEELDLKFKDPVKDQVGVLEDVYADALTTPTMGQYGLNLMQLNTLKNAGYSNSQIEEAAERGYAEELVRNIEGPIGVV